MKKFNHKSENWDSGKRSSKNERKRSFVSKTSETVKGQRQRQYLEESESFLDDAETYFEESNPS